jgi:RNA polymerase sigma-70 factor (ECF subfamily)
MNAVEMGDGELLRAVQSGDSDALGQLYDRFGRLVFSLAWHITGEKSMAEEVTQEVFVQVWNKSATYQAELGKVPTWLASIARHRAIDAVRRRKIRPEETQISWDADDLPELPDDVVIEAEVEWTQERVRVRQAIAQLPEEQRAVLALAFFRGYSHQEIARAVGEPLGTVKTRIRLAMQKLRRMLEDSDP